MIAMLIIFGFILFLIYFFIYSLCKIASIADNKIEYMYQKERIKDVNKTTARTD